MIPKNKCKDGVFYKGVCRNARIAMWDGSSETFWHFRSKFGWRTDQIEHFEDVKEINRDGFIPIEEIEYLPPEQAMQEKIDAGYYK